MSDNTEKPSEPLPKPADILAEIRSDRGGVIESRYARRFNRESMDAQEGYEHLRGLRDHYKHKSLWSKFLMGAMAFMIGYQSYLLFKVGTKSWDFSEYEWLLPALLVQNLAQVIGLAVFVVKALFKDIKR